ncbi:hypothetical protein [Flavobacterium sp. N2820]|uniref:hypothetical protein n=1 Tax=Flavobacterium sp. N2820 TaxID=2986834 RepID=UPI002224B8AE|nr:hypothetical protein [Flavobacterium sp. N2820]
MDKLIYVSIIIVLIFYIIVLYKKYALLNKREIDNHKVNLEYQLKHELIEKTKDFDKQIYELNKQLLITERESYLKGRQEASEEFKNDFQVKVYAYKEEIRQKNNNLLSIGNKEFIEIGYKYQLFVKGIPALGESKIPIQTYKLSDFKLNDEAIMSLVSASVGDKADLAMGVIKIMGFKK